MAEKNRVLDKELRHALNEEDCYTIMDFLMVEFSDRKDYHYNYYFDTPERSLSKHNTTLRLRTVVKDHDISYHLTLKVPTIDEDTHLEYHERLDEKEMRLLAYNNKLPHGEIAELTSIHGGKVQLVNVIKVNRVFAMYMDQQVFFDRISHRGRIYFEIGTRIDQTKNGDTERLINQFKGLLNKFDIIFKQAERRSVKFR